jgi:hypothetical protein
MMAEYRAGKSPPERVRCLRHMTTTHNGKPDGEIIDVAVGEVVSVADLPSHVDIPHEIEAGVLEVIG